MGGVNIALLMGVLTMATNSQQFGCEHHSISLTMQTGSMQTFQYTVSIVWLDESDSLTYAQEQMINKCVANFSHS